MAFKAYILNGTQVVDNTFPFSATSNIISCYKKTKNLKKTTVLITMTTKYYTFSYDIIQDLHKTDQQLSIVMSYNQNSNFV